MTIRKPSSYRTGTAQWKKLRAKRRQHDFDNGLTQCPECNIWLDWEYSLRPNSAEVDHIIPASQGGQDTFENCRVICRQCNQRLGAKVGNKRKAKQAVKVEYKTKLNW